MLTLIDNYDLFDQHDEDQESKLDKLPICEDCGEHIQDEYLFDVDGCILCRDCMEIRYEKAVDNYVRE